MRRLAGTALAIAILAAPPAPSAVGQPADLDCLIQAWETVALASAADGLVEHITVDRGDVVTRGQVLVVLESSLERAALEMARARAGLEAAYKSAEARVEFGTRRFLRTQDLFKQNLIPEKEMDEAETGKVLADLALLEARENRRLAELEVRRAQAALDLRTIRSPVAGVVVERLLAPGETTGRSPILRLAQIDPLRVEVFVPVALLGRIRVGARAQVVPEAPANSAHTGQVVVVDRVVDSASGTFGVRLELPNPDHRLPAGLKCKVRFP